MSDFVFKKMEDGRLIDAAGSCLVVSKDGHLIHVPQAIPALKDGQRFASESDVKKALSVKAAREAAEAEGKAAKSPPSAPVKAAKPEASK